MKKMILALACLFPLAGTAQDKFQISGTLSAIGTGRIVMLNYKNSEGKKVRDSAVVRNGKFVLTGTTAFGNKADISLLPANRDSIPRGTPVDNQMFYLEKGGYVLTGTNSIAKAMITGTPVQEDYLQYVSQMDKPRTEHITALKGLMKARTAKDTVEMQKIQAELKTLRSKENAVEDSFIFSHPDSYITLDIVDQEKAVVINPTFLDPYYKVLSKRMLNSFTGKQLVDRYEKATQLAIGKTLDFTQTDDKGNEFKLSSLKGKYVLVDFWASWCGPCRAEIPHLLKAYNQLKDKKFEIVSVSLDETKAAWLKAVVTDKMPWIQVSDLKGFKNDVAAKYGITAIPQNVLINPNGVIIAKDLRGEDVKDKLSVLIK